MIRVSLIGNPNTGKTTLFNTLTNSNEHVGNWHGVTVEEKAKTIFFKQQEIEIVDLPGIYSLSRLSFEEKVATDYLLSHQNDLVINICDYNNLQRNLYLTLGLLELGLKVIVVVNQIEKKKVGQVNLVRLEEKLGVKILSIDAANKESALQLKEEILCYKSTKCFLPYLKFLPLKQAFEVLPQYLQQQSRIFYAIKLLEDDQDLKQKFAVEQTFDMAEKVAKVRYDFIDQLMSECGQKNFSVYGQSRLDKILLNKFFALPAFLLILAAIFYLTFFSLGSFLSDGLSFLLEKFVSSPVLAWLEGVAGKSSWIYSFFEGAIFGGAGSVLTFLPQVALLFVCLSVLEDSGYLARVAFVFEDVLSKVGLSGKSVYTLLMGFGCSTSAILTSRNMEDDKAKIKTALLTPYMSCSAKFPIYVCLGGAFFGASNIFIIMGLYILGVVVAVLMSMLFEKTVLKSKEQSFILEFPPYRRVGIKQVFKVFVSSCKDFLSRVGGLIITMNIIVWVMANFSFSFGYVAQNGGQSILESLGAILAPVFAPLGFGSWGPVSALIAGLIAKEVILSSIALFNNVEGGQTQLALSLSDPSSAVYFSSASSVLSYLVFCLLYFPCLSSVGVLGKEIGKKWTIFGCLTQFVVAYFIAMAFYNFAVLISLFGWWRVCLGFVAIFAIVFALIAVIKRCRLKGRQCDKCKKGCTKIEKGE